MQKWEVALNKFIKRYQDEPYFEGAVACGSFVSGNQNAFSDIDVHIIISDNQDWRHRGNTRIDGFLIEFFINPIKQMSFYFQEEYKTARLATSNMIAYGNVLFDKNGKVQRLQEEAKRILEKDLLDISKNDLQQRLYHLWDGLDEIKSLASSNHNFSIIYYQLLWQLVETFYAYHKIPHITPSKIEKIFTDPSFKERYGIKKMPPPIFIETFLQALNECRLENIETLYDFVISQCDGFDIEHFNLKTPLTL